MPLNSDFLLGVVLTLILVAAVAIGTSCVCLVKVRRRLRRLEHDMHELKQLTLLDDLNDLLVVTVVAESKPPDSHPQEVAV